MNESIEQNCQVDISIIENIGIEPVEQKNGCMMVNMEKTKLLPLFTNHNKNCIPKIPHFRNVKSPQQVGQRRVFCIESHTGHDTVTIAISKQKRFNRHVGAEHHLRNVVQELNRVRVHSWQSTRFHHGTSDNDEAHVRHGYNGSTAEVSEWPSFRVASDFLGGVCPAEDCLSDRV